MTTARVSQVNTEVVDEGVPDPRISTVSVDVVDAGVPDPRISTVSVEVINGGVFEARISDIYIEVIVDPNAGDQAVGQNRSVLVGGFFDSIVTKVESIGY